MTGLKMLIFNAVMAVAGVGTYFGLFTTDQDAIDLITNALYACVVAGNFVLRFYTSTPVGRSEPSPLKIGEMTDGSAIIVRHPKGEKGAVVQVQADTGVLSAPAMIKLDPVDGTVEQMYHPRRRKQIINMQRVRLTAVPTSKNPT